MSGVSPRAHLEGFGIVVSVRPPFLIERPLGAPETLRAHALEASTAEVIAAPGGGRQMRVLPGHSPAPFRAVTGGPPGDWTVRWGALACAFPPGLAMLSTPIAGSPFELRFTERVVPPSRLVLPGQSAARALRLPDGSAFTLAAEVLTFLEPVASREPTALEDFAAKLVQQGRSLIRLGRTPGAMGEVGVADLAARDAQGRPVRERWYLAPIGADQAVPLLLTAGTSNFDLTVPLGDLVAGSLRGPG